jgi:hypothetical protein
LLTLYSSVGVWLPLLKHKVATLDALNSVEDAQALLDIFTNSRKDYFCQYSRTFGRALIANIKLFVSIAITCLPSQHYNQDEYGREGKIGPELYMVGSDGPRNITRHYACWVSAYFKGRHMPLL